MNIPIQFLDNKVSDRNTLIREQILSFLHSRNFSAFRNVEVEAVDGAVLLRGITRSYYHKQLVLSHSKSLIGDYKLIDEIDVQKVDFRS